VVHQNKQILPIVSHKDEIQETVQRNPVTILVGETGSGKTTQVPQYLLEADFGQRKRIGVTQPRRIAAISVAQYVAGQLGCKIGEEVGYQIRFDDTTTEGTRIKFMTDGILLQETKTDPDFTRYEVLIFDEAHERALNTDFCLGLAKRALAANKDLKIVVMSATIDAEKFAAFFDHAPIINVEGRMYPVEVRYLTPQDIAAAKDVYVPSQDDKPSNAKEIASRAALKVKQIHERGAPGDILVFMPRKEEIHHTIQSIENLGLRDLHTLAVHGDMNPDDQRRIFDSFPGRKVVVATNIAETSITVEGIVFVVDSCLINQTDFNPYSGIGSLQVMEHSKSGLEQRKGRAGRTQPGVCYRLCTEDEYERGRWQYRRSFGSDETRPQFTKPEIQRSDLAGVVLRMIGIGITDPEHFEFVDAPDPEVIQNACDTLRAIGALTEKNEITEIGQRLLDLPVEPRIGRMILAAEEYGCTDEIVTIAGSLSARNIFVRPKDKEAEADVAKERFVDKRSDFLTLLDALKAYEAEGRDRDWAKDNFLHWRALDEILKIHRQLAEILERRGIAISSIGYRKPRDEFALTDEEKRHGEAIGKAVTAGLLQNVAVFSGSFRNGYQRGRDYVFIHPGSAIFRDSPRIVTSSVVVETTKPYARNCQAVEVEWLQEIAPHLITTEASEPQWGYLDDGFMIRKRTFFNGMKIAEESFSAPKGPELTREFARRLVTGYPSLPCCECNRDIMRELERLHRESNGETRIFTDQDLEEFYVERLGDANTKAEAEQKNLFLNLDDFVSKEDQERYRSVPEPTFGSRTSGLLSRWRTPPVEESEPITIDETLQTEINDLRRTINAMLVDHESYGFRPGYQGRLKAGLLLDRLDAAERALKLGLDAEEHGGTIKFIRDSVNGYLQLRERKLKRGTAKRERLVEQEREVQEREQEKQAWREFEADLVALKERCRQYSGFGVYTFPIDKHDEPQDYRDDRGVLFQCDLAHSEVLPEHGVSAYWGYITQHATGHGQPTMVALLMAVQGKPKQLDE